MEPDSVGGYHVRRCVLQPELAGELASIFSGILWSRLRGGLAGRLCHGSRLMVDVRVTWILILVSAMYLTRINYDSDLLKTHARLSTTKVILDCDSVQ